MPRGHKKKNTYKSAHNSGKQGKKEDEHGTSGIQQDLKRKRGAEPEPQGDVARK